MDEYQSARREMVKKQIEHRGIHEPRLLAAFASVPRHLFVPSSSRKEAYQDRALPIGFGQTISQPYMVAAMTDLLALTGDEKVLEVGTGSGYQAAILSHLAAQVYTIEYDADLALQARDLLKELGRKNVHLRLGDGSLGWSENSPYDGIIVTAFGPRVPQPLLDQLSDGGRLVMPIGNRSMQSLEIWTRVGGTFQHSGIMPVVFVPLRGEFGWKEE